MFFTGLKVVGVFVLVFAVYVFYSKFFIPYLERERLRKQGVVYMDRPFLDEIQGLLNS